MPWHAGCVRCRACQLQPYSTPDSRWMSKRMPWGPSKISLKKLISPTHTMGVMSTPPTRGMTFRVTFKTGSVGAYASSQGSFVPSIEGYQVIGMRMMYSSVNTVNSGRKMVSSVCAAAASRSAKLYSSMPAPDTAACAAPPVASSAAIDSSMLF